MDFRTPDGGRFEVPDDWWACAEMATFSRGRARSYLPIDTVPGVELVPLEDVEPPTRAHGVPAFKRARFVSLLFAVQAGNALPSVQVWRLTTPGRFRYRVYDGFHRYHVSIAVGYPMLPVICLGDAPG